MQRPSSKDRSKRKEHGGAAPPPYKPPGPIWQNHTGKDISNAIQLQDFLEKSNNQDTKENKQPWDNIAAPI